MRLKRPMMQLILLTGMVVVFASHAQQPPTLFETPLSPRIANYNIDVRLDSENNLLNAQQVLIWHNQTANTISELQFHLYMNAFRNSESTFMQGGSNPLRSQRIPDKGWGFVEIDRLTVNYWDEVAELPQPLLPDQALKLLPTLDDLSGRMRFIQPDDDNRSDKSVAVVTLPRPLPPGEKIIVYIDFRTRLPEPLFSRTGRKSEYFMVGQWFPKIGVFIDGAWNTHQFNSRTNFFADFGVYNVRMTVPADHVLGATGLPVSVTQNDDRTATHFYHAEDVHDFAWASSPEFVEVRGKSQDVDIRLLLQSDHLDTQQRMLYSTAMAIKHFQDWYGDYPYPNVTVIDQRRGSSANGGMEYPTLFTTTTSYGLPEGLRLPEMINIHEFGHAYWYHMLASNEFEEAWLDEGVNTYTDMQIMPAVYGPEANTIDVLGIKLNQTTFARMQYMSLPDADPIMQATWEFYSGQSYNLNSYAKPGLVLTTLQNYLGWETMLEAMRSYVRRWRFQHPKSRDFFDVINDVSGQNLDWFFDQAFYSNAILDYTVSSVFSRPARNPKGYDFTLSASLSDSSEHRKPEAAEADSLHGKKPEEFYDSGVSVRRLGEFKFPVELEVVFDDGEVIRETWDGQALWTKFRYRKPARLLSATVDPDGKIPLDINLTNNSRVVGEQMLGINKLSLRWMFWQQFMLDQPDFANLLFRMAGYLN